MSSDDFLGERRQALVDEFFRKEEAQKLAKYKVALAAQVSREELRRASGVEDDGVLDHLVELGLSADTVAALTLAPLIHVAWADGKVQSRERDAILKAAASKGIDADAPARHFLEAWLSGDHPATLFATWSGYIQSLGKVLTPDQLGKLRDQVVGFSRKVAESAGGFLGLGNVSDAEEDALSQIESAFDRRL